MKKTLGLILLLIMCCGVSYAQKHNGHYSLTGIIADSATGKGIADANIVILARADNANLGGAAADKNGKFTVENISMSNIRLRVSMIGYQSKVIDSVSLENISRLGVIKLRATAYEIPEIVIKTIKPMVETHVDKQIINIDQVPTGTGTLTDALKNSGTVEVDPQTNAITVRGEAVKIQMDGHPYELPADMLAQLPANIADQVEVIIAPSASESAEGGTYILNIISKKSILESYSGSIGANISTNNRYMGGLNLNYKRDKINIFSTFYGGSFKMDGSNFSDRYNYLSNSFYNQKSGGNNNNKFTGGFYKLGMDYYPDKINSFTVTAQFNNYHSQSNSIQSTAVSDTAMSELYNFNQNSDNSNNSNYFSIYGFYKRKFEKKGEEFTLDALFTRITSPANSDMDFNYSNKVYPEEQKSSTSENARTFILKANYVNPTDIGKFETGYNLTLRDRTNNYNVLNYLAADDEWSDTARLSNYFKYKENINAVYVTYGNQFGKFEVKTGLRMENLNTHGDQITTKESFSENYFNLFPNFNLSYKFSDMFQLIFNTTRRVQYPNMYYLNPFKKYNGPNSYTAGNPEIKPQFIASYNLSLSQFASIFYNHSVNNISYATAVVQDSISFNSPINLNSTKSYGFELTLPYYNSPMSPVHLPDFISMLNISFRYNHRKQAGQYLNEQLTYESDSKSLNVNLGLNLWYGINANTMFMYRPKVVTIKNSQRDMKDLTLMLSKSFMNNKLRLNLMATDLLNEQKFDNITYGTTYKIISNYRPGKTQSIMVGITYMFNDYTERHDRNIDDGRDAGTQSGF